MLSRIKLAAGIAALCGGIAIPWQAHAIRTVYYITAECVDCAAAADQLSYPISAELTLQDYTKGADIELGHFVAFRYGGSNLMAPISVTWAWDDGDPATLDFRVHSVEGKILNDPGANDLLLRFDLTEWQLDEASFYTSSRDNWWSLCSLSYPTGGITYCPSDHGREATFRSVSEPESMELSLFSLAFLAMAWHGPLPHLLGSPRSLQ